jgi:hypothetical protein
MMALCRLMRVCVVNMVVDWNGAAAKGRGSSYGQQHLFQGRFRGRYDRCMVESGPCFDTVSPKMGLAAPAWAVLFFD